MKMKSLEVIGFMGRDDPLRMNFHEDINIFTGRNGSGKTNVLKLLWYTSSGNIAHALREVPFKKMTLRTTEYGITVYRLSPYTCRIELDRAGALEEYEDVADEDGDVIIDAEDQVQGYLGDVGASLFFPTFRRIEGGFTLSGERVRTSGTTNTRVRGDIEESLTMLSRRLTRNNHKFVASLSTVDINGLLIKEYTTLAEQYNKYQEATTKDVIARIKELKSEKTETVPTSSLTEIQKSIEGMDGTREMIMKPMDAITGQVLSLFRMSGLRVGREISFGDAASAINSDALSAGEKQMLSFISYNGFTKDSVVLIDEPELSLHVDWQRQLFPMLLSQQTSNQFIVATHSPFIYSKYPDKEIRLDADRGDAQE
jgi:predicted ATPase